jgi:hypothetical protein
MIEDQAIATQISETMLNVSEQLDASIYAVMEHCSYEEFQEYRRAVGAVLGEIVLGILNPLYARHPDLKPPEMH